MGRDWISQLEVDLKSIHMVTSLTPLQTLLDTYSAVFTDELGCLKGEALQADSLLTHYDTTKPLLLACDASDYGIGAVLSHIGDDSQERPVAYASRTLSSAEKHYSQLEKEALAIAGDVTS